MQIFFSVVSVVSVAEIVNQIRCDNCIFSTWLVGVGRPVLMCRQKTGFAGQWRSLPLDDKCANFYPGTNFKLSLPFPRRIPLTKGKFALVDAEDYYRLAQFKWFVNFNGITFYAVRRSGRKRVIMHREIMAAPGHLVVDHIDHNGLNNRKSNLRLCSKAQNNCNSTSIKGATSKYKGVSWNTAKKKWFASIKYSGKIYRLGYFTDEIAAAITYDKKACQLHHEFAYLNFPP